MNELGKKVKEIRLAHKLTQQEFADSLGYSHKSVINKIESGQRDMSYEKILLMIKLYKLDIKEVHQLIPESKPVSKEEPKDNKKKKNDKVVVYIHGQKGNAKESKLYSFIKNYDIKGLDYQDGNVWENGEVIKEKFAKLIKPYKEVVVIANSVGAFYALEYLSSFNIKKAFFISPLVDMFQAIFDMMNAFHVTEKRLKTEKFVTLENGITLSYDFYNHVIQDDDNWKVPTDILYGELDEVVYLESIADFLGRHDATLTIMQGAHHYLHTDEEKAFIKKWISSRLK